MSGSLKARIMAEVPVPGREIGHRLVALGSGRFVHMRVAGSGPPVLMLHESPRSSGAMVGLMRRLAGAFTVIALDTPGYGLSDPLPPDVPEIADYAGIVPVVLDALGIGKVLVYAVHTGALIGVEAARRFPDRIGAVVADGYPVFTPEERSEHLKHYLPPFRPSPDGTHAAWLWARVRDQFTVFPWHGREDAGRLGFGPPPAMVLDRVARDFLAAGDGYRTAYAAAFRYQSLAPLADMRVPVMLCFRPDDVLDAHRSRVGPTSGPVATRQLSGDRESATAEIATILAGHSEALRATDAGRLMTADAEGEESRRLVHDDGLVAEWHISGAGRGPAIVLVPDWPHHTRPVEAIADRLSDRFEVHLMALRQWPARGGSAALCRVIAKETAGAALAGFFGASAPLARASAAARTVLCDPWALSGESDPASLPDLTPVWDGSHITRAFSMARDLALYRPFQRPDNCALRDLAEAAAERLHARFSAIAQGGVTGVQHLAELLKPAQQVPACVTAIIDEAEPDSASQSDAALSLGLAVRTITPQTAGIAAALAAVATMCAAA